MSHWLTRLGSVARGARGLRMRLTLSYVLFFALLLVGIGFLFRQALIVILEQQNQRVLDGEWRTVRGFLRVQNGELVWAYDPDDPEESFTVERLRRVILLTDAQGGILEISNGYSAIGGESRDQIRRVLTRQQPLTVLRQNRSGEAYMVRMGLFRDHGKDHFLSIGLPIEESLRIPDRLLTVYFSALPVLLIVIVILGWYAAGRALQPLQKVADAAEAVAAGNLSHRVPSIGTGDELDQLIGTFNRMMERLELNFRQVQQFSVDASHELRTPITAIRGQLEVALFTAETREQYRDAIVTALQDVERLGQIVKSLLLLAQAESGQLKLQKAPQDLVASADELVSQFRMAADEKQVRIQFDAPDRVIADVDRVQFGRLVYNLLSNAVKHTPRGGQVLVALTREGGEICLSISDNGPGISAVHIPHLFERFYRIRDGGPDADKGIGLGLAFVAWIVKSHGGRVNLESAVGRGTTVRVHMPVGLPPDAAGTPLGRDNANPSSDTPARPASSHRQI